MKAVIWCAVSSQAQAAEDKISLPEQERAARAWCRENGYTVTHVLKVEGYSRRESDILTALDDFAAQGVDAYHRLRELWQQKTFDVLVAYTHSRFGRSSTLHAWVIENVINSGANIYLLQGGWVKPDDFRFQIALGGVSATVDIDRLIKARAVAMDKRAAQGLPTGSGVALSHCAIRDERGRIIRLKVNEERRRLWDDLAELLLAGVGYRDLPGALAERGHFTAKGKKFAETTIYKMLFSTTFWGHSARRYRHKPSGLWCIQPGHPIPEGVIIHYNTFDPVYTGDQAQQVIAELKRRKTLIRGHASPENTTRFRGIAICWECSRPMVIMHRHRNYPRLRCSLRTRTGVQSNNCSQSKSIWVMDVQAYLADVLGEMLHLEAPDLFDQKVLNGSTGDREANLNGLRKEITDIEDELRSLIVKEAMADETLQSIYTDEISWRTYKLKALRTELNQRELHDQVSRNEMLERQQGYKTLRRLSLEEFWKLPEREVNQVLHQLMGDVRIVVRDGKIQGLARVE